MISATVSKILNYSCVDGPGNRMVIFLQGCNYRCKNCHNPQTIDICNQCGDCVSTCPTQSLTLKRKDNKQYVAWNLSSCIECDKCLTTCNKQSTPKTQQLTVMDVIERIKENLAFINGITITGGEATLQLPFIIALFRLIKTDISLKHLSCMVDSNGSLNVHGWKPLLPFLDGAMIDLKAWDHHVHQKLTGRDNQRVLTSIDLLHQHHKLYEVRLLHIPNITDYEQNIEPLCDFLKKVQTNARIKINGFQHHGVQGEALTWATSTKTDVEQLAKSLTQHGVTNLVLPNVYL